MEDRDISVMCATEKLAEIVVTLGEAFLPLHVYNMAKRSYLKIKKLSRRTLVAPLCLEIALISVFTADLNSQRSLRLN